MKLYEIDVEIEQAINAMLDSVNEETGEVDSAAVESLTQLQAERERKIENIACYIKNLKADADAYKAEIDSLNKRKKAAENKAARLQSYLELHLSPDEKFSFPRAAISFRKSKKVIIINESLLPKRLFRIKKEPDKVAIKDEFVAGKKVKGCDYVDSYSMQIK